MITFMESKEKLMEVERCLDSQLWHACAGGMVQMPAPNSRVFYFPQGHAEHASGPVDFSRPPNPVPPYILCRVASVKFMADPDTDEVFAKLRLSPAGSAELAALDDLGSNTADAEAAASPDKPASFAKTLTQSDANNGGGFSVPRYCAETIFPRLDYAADPPVQTILARDVHGETWKFRHIYRGTPRRHLLTTGWSTFVNHKKLVAGDSIVFLRAENGELCVGIRRAKRGVGSCHELSSGWNSCSGPYGGGFSAFLRDEDSRVGQPRSGSGGGVKGKVRPEAVVEASRMAARGETFEVVYYPRASTPEFCVKAVSVRAALQIRWCPGMRFKMAFETEDSSRISWFMGTVSAVQVSDSIRWPDSPWRLLQVNWDEPDLLQNVKRVSPWLVEVVSNIPAIHLSPFSPPRKKPRMLPHLQHQHPHHLDFPTFHGSNHPLLLGCLPDNTTPAGMQGARHTPPSHFHIPHVLFGHSPARALFPPPPVPTDNVSCLLTISRPPAPRKAEPQQAHLILFGKPILTEQQISLMSSGNNDDGNDDIGNLETGHCKVFMESEDVGRTLNLSLLASYDELYNKLAEMFGVENSETMSHAKYRDGFGAVRHIGDEPFSEFTKTAKRLTILLGSSGENNDDNNNDDDNLVRQLKTEKH